MSQSAMSIRESKRLDTSRRIVLCAAELTSEHGLDGWTMDQLAEEAGVSRRTLFNYFPAKIDAVLGPVPDFPAEAIEEFRRGGPTGGLVEDLRLLALSILEEKDFDRRTVEVRRRVLTGNPRLLLVVHERFEQVTAEVVDHILVREGPGFGAARARLLVRLLVALFDGCLQELQEDDTERPVAAMLDEALASARELLA